MLIALGSLLAPAPAPAQEPPGRTPAESAEADTLPAFELPPLEVAVARSARPASRMPAAVSVRGRETIQRARAGVGLEESLAAIPGVVVSNRHNLAVDSRVAIRGLGARAGFGVRGVRILVDGIPLTTPDGQATLNNLALGATGQIEVIRGPASALYGNAAGGVISIRSESPPADGPGLEARLVAGDQGTGSADAMRKLDVKLGAPGERRDFLAALSRLELGGHREHARAEHTVLLGRARQQIGDRGDLVVVINAAHLPRAENPGSLPLDSARLRPNMAWPANVQQGAGKTARQLQAGVAYSRRWRDDGRLDVAVHGVDRSMENPLPFAYIGLDRIAGGMRASVQDAVDLPFGRLYVTTGLDAEFQRDDRLEHANSGGEPTGEARRNQRDRVTGLGPFVQVQLVARPELELLLGLRHDVVGFRVEDRPLERQNPDGRDLSGDRRLGAPSHIVGALYELRPGLALYGNAATSFQTPTTTELLNAPPLVPGEGSPPGFNPELEPERATSLEAGVRAETGRVRFDLALFRMRVRDLLVSFQVPEEPGRDFFRNAAGANQTGVEAGLGLELGGGWGLDAAYTFSRFVFADDAEHPGNRVPGVPPHRLYAGIRYTHAVGVRGEASVEQLARFAVDDANQHHNPGYQVVDLRLSLHRQLGRLGLAPFVAVHNLFDKRYNASVVVNAVGDRFYEPGPGRSLMLGLSVPYGLWASGQPGR